MSKRSSEDGGEPEIKRQREGEYNSLHHLTKVVRNVLKNDLLRKNIMSKVSDIHETLGFNYLLGPQLDFLSNYGNNVAKGKVIYNNKSLYTYIKFGCTQWFIEEYEKLCTLEVYPRNDKLLEIAINYKNTTIIDKLLLNPNMVLNNFKGMWTNSMLKLGYHEGLIQKFKMKRPIIHQNLINALSSGSLKLIKYLIDNQMVLSEEKSKLKVKQEFYRSQIEYNNDKYIEQKWILNPSMYDMVLLIKQNGLCTGIVLSTLLKCAYIHQASKSVLVLLFQGVKPNNDIIEYIMNNYHPDKILNLLNNFKSNEKDDTSKQPFSLDNFKKLLWGAVDKGPPEVINWAISKCSKLEKGDWVHLFKLALKNGNQEILQLAFAKAGQIRQQDIYYKAHYKSVSHIEIHPTMLKHEVFTQIGMSVCNPHVINCALDNDREDIIQEALTNPEHWNKRCLCYKESSGCNTSMLLNAIRRGRRDVVDWALAHHKQLGRNCSCQNMGFEESLKNGHLDMAKLFVDNISNHVNHGCGSSYNYISGCAKNLGRMDLNDLGKVSIGQLIAATTFKDTSITEDLIISVLENGVNIASGAYGYTYLTDASSAYFQGMMKLVRYILKGKNEVHPSFVTHGRLPKVINPEAIEYFIQSKINIPNEPNILFVRQQPHGYSFNFYYLFYNLLNSSREKYGLNIEHGMKQEKSLREFQLESLKTDQLNDYKMCISILHQLNEIKQTVEISNLEILVLDHFDLIQMLIREENLWASCLQPSKSVVIKSSFDIISNRFKFEGMKCFWNYMHEIELLSPTLHKEIGILYPFNNNYLVNIARYNHHQFLNVAFNHPHSPLYNRQSFENGNPNNHDPTIKQFLNMNQMKTIKYEAYIYGNIHIINMCNNIINYLNRDIQTNKS